MSPTRAVNKPPRRTDISSGRKFSAGELQLMLLQLLADAPAHGYELIKRLSDLSQGYYRPSPGVLYPALAQLEDKQLTEVTLSGRRKKYHLTASGQTYLKQHTTQAKTLFAQLSHAAKKMLWLTHAEQDLQTASDMTGWLPEYIEARKALRHALLAVDDSSHSTQQSVSDILQRAAQEILNKHT